jgi:DTW domain-containing protein YfiP
MGLEGQRLVLNPRKSSLYAELRREPRREGLSTIEAAALTLSRIEQRPEIEAVLRASFTRMLERYRAAKSQNALGDRATKEAAPKSARGFRRKRR